MGRKSKHYAVARGRVPGIYLSWPEAEAQVKGFEQAAFKSFATRQEAEQFLRSPPPPQDPSRWRNKKRKTAPEERTPVEVGQSRTAPTNLPQVVAPAELPQVVAPVELPQVVAPVELPQVTAPVELPQVAEGAVHQMPPPDARTMHVYIGCAFSAAQRSAWFALHWSEPWCRELNLSAPYDAAPPHAPERALIAAALHALELYQQRACQPCEAVLVLHFGSSAYSVSMALGRWLHKWAADGWHARLPHVDLYRRAHETLSGLEAALPHEQLPRFLCHAGGELPRELERAQASAADGLRGQLLCAR